MPKTDVIMHYAVRLIQLGARPCRQRLDLSLRLRHDDADMVIRINRVAMKPSIHWNKGDFKYTPNGVRTEGKREFSYCSFPLLKAVDKELDEAIHLCLEKLTSAELAVSNFVKSGGTASLAIGWFCLGDTGAQIRALTVSALARMSLTVDYYLYFTAAEAIQ